jgi:hypothetical protein
MLAVTEELRLVKTDPICHFLSLSNRSVGPSYWPRGEAQGNSNKIIEEVAAFAAGAEAHLTGKLAACAGSCAPGNMHLIKLGFLTDEQFDSWVRPQEMAHPLGGERQESAAMGSAV